MSFFREASSDISLKNQNKILEDPLIYKNFVGERDEADIYILAEKPMSGAELYSFKKFMGNNFREVTYCLYSSIIIAPTKKDLSSQITKFYKINRTDLSSFIPKGSQVIAIGRANIAVTKSDDLLVSKKPDEDKSIISGFYDTLLGNTFYFSPELKAKIWPIDPLHDWLNKDNFEKWFCKTQIDRASKDDWVPKRPRLPKVVHVDNPNAWLLERVNGTEMIGWDIETIGLDPWAEDGDIIEISFTFDGNTGYHLFWKDIDTSILSLFMKGRKGIGTNIKFDIQWLVVKGGIPFENLLIHSDTMHYEHTVNEKRRIRLKSSVWIHTEDLGGYDQALDNYLEEHPECKSNYSLIPDDLRIPYSATDPCASWRVHFAIEKEAEELNSFFEKERQNNKFLQNTLSPEWSIQRYYYEIKIPTVRAFCKAEMKGIGVNINKLREMSEGLHREIREIEIELHTLLGTSSEAFNLRSGEQLGKLIESKGWKIEERGKNNTPLTNDACLQRWKTQGRKEAELILKLREKDAMMKTFIGKEKDNTGFWKYLTYDKELGEEGIAVIHPKILVMLAESERSKHYAPNTANIPSHGDKAFYVRQQFAPKKKDNVFVSADQSGLQVRIATMLSKDPVLSDVFSNDDGDVHLRTSHVIFWKNKGITYEELKKRKKEEDSEVLLKRFKSKSAVFGFLFGLSFISFAERNLKPVWTEEECDNYISDNNLQDSFCELQERFYSDKLTPMENLINAKYLTVAKAIREAFFSLYSGLAKWLEDVKTFAKEHYYTISPYWKVRRLPELSYIGADSNKAKVANLINISINSPVQNMESVIMNRSLVKSDLYFEANNLESHFFGQVHDAVELEVTKTEIPTVCHTLKEESEKMYPEYNGIPLEMEGTVNDYWGTYEKWHLDEKTGKRKEDWELWDVGGKNWLSFMSA